MILVALVTLLTTHPEGINWAGILTTTATVTVAVLAVIAGVGSMVIRSVDNRIRGKMEPSIERMEQVLCQGFDKVAVSMSAVKDDLANVRERVARIEGAKDSAKPS